ncbi:MAG: 50S ribosomal protein L23 [Bacteroidetes bacterium]|jgi:large subunit ribosomal protein L23|nr:50S ribosomal protein L23 [Bacteroidota bacterium]
MNVILKPIITEKMTQMGEKLNRYGFKVDKRANKLQIRKAIKDIYGVEVADINTMVYRGKSKTRYSKSGFISGKSNNYKKAIVTLAKGETIDFYSNI